jgi:sorbitol-specific phosphotransferase system component IIC
MKKIKSLNIARILIIAYALFIGIFALDAESLVGFLIHILPSLIFITTLVITWKNPRIAGILFVLEGIGTIIVFNTYRDLFVLLVVSLLPILTGLLFFFSKNPKH